MNYKTTKLLIKFAAIILIVSLQCRLGFSKGSVTLDNKIQSISDDIYQKMAGKPNVLLMDFCDRNGLQTTLGRTITNSLSQSLSSHQDISIIDHEQLSQVWLNKNIGATGLTDADSAAKLGKNVGARTVVFGSSLNLEHTLEINIFIVDVDNEILSGAFTYEVTKDDELSEFLLAQETPGDSLSNQSATHSQVEDHHMEASIQERVRMELKKQSVAATDSKTPSNQTGRTRSVQEIQTRANEQFDSLQSPQHRSSVQTHPRRRVYEITNSLPPLHRTASPDALVENAFNSLLP